MKPITADIQAAFKSWQEAEFEFPVNAGSYDRTHANNVKRGKRWAKLLRLIEAEGLNVPATLSKLSH